ncbi:hypothetical protein YC2023_029147 [Brassica napus]
MLLRNCHFCNNSFSFSNNAVDGDHRDCTCTSCNKRLASLTLFCICEKLFLFKSFNSLLICFCFQHRSVRLVTRLLPASFQACITT